MLLLEPTRRSHRAGVILPLILLLPFTPMLALAASPVADPNGPLVVTGNSHVVVIEYEAWPGPNAVTFQGTAAKPKLRSADMAPLGGGYDSADPAVIQQHVAWLEYMGMDAATIDLTNNVACIFSSEWFVKKYVPSCTSIFRSENQSIRDNTGNLYPAWSALGTTLKLIPLMGGIDQNAMRKDRDGKTALAKEIEYFGALMRKYHGLNVIYHGKPLMLIYLGAAQDPNPADKSIVVSNQKVLEEPSRDHEPIHLQIGGGLSRQPAGPVGHARHSERADRDQSKIRLLERG